MSATKNDLTDTTEVMEGYVTTPFQLSSYADDGNLALAYGRSEEIGNRTYTIDTSNFTITDSASDGIAYVYVSENGDGDIIAELLNNTPSYISYLKGWFYGQKKALFKLTKSGSTYSNKLVLSAPGNSYYEDVDITETLCTDLVVKDMILNTTQNRIKGTVDGFNIAPYLASGFSVTDSASFLFRIGKMVFVNIRVQAPASTSTVFSGIPAEWRPASTQGITGTIAVNVLVTYPAEFYINSNGTITYTATGSAGSVAATGFYLTS